MMRPLSLACVALLPFAFVAFACNGSTDDGGARGTAATAGGGAGTSSASGGAGGEVGASGGAAGEGGSANGGPGGASGGTAGAPTTGGGAAGAPTAGGAAGSGGIPGSSGEGGAPACIPVKPNEAGGGAVAYFALSPPVGKSCTVEGIEVCGDDNFSGNPPAWSQCVNGVWATSTRTDPCPLTGCNVSHASPIVEGSCCFGPPRFCQVFGLCDGTSWHPEPLARIVHAYARALTARRRCRCPRSRVGSRPSS